jgi:hypothetical protein
MEAERGGRLDDEAGQGEGAQLLQRHVPTHAGNHDLHLLLSGAALRPAFRREQGHARVLRRFEIGGE